MKIPPLTVNEWQGYLASIAPKNNTSPHSYLCLTSRNNGPRKWEILTPEQYRDFFKSPSKTDYCVKLSLNQIYDISKSFIDKQTTLRFGKFQFQVNYQSAIDSKIESFVQTKMNVFSPSIEEDAKAFMKQLKELVGTTSALFGYLKPMADRACYKRQQAKIQGLWGKVKYYLWSCFYDKRESIEKLNANISPNLASHIKLKMIEEIKCRIFVNLTVFQEEATPPIPPITNLRHFDFEWIQIPEDEDKIKTPLDIKNWLDKYDPDKYTYSDKLCPGGKEYADKARIRIAALLKVWEALQ